MKKALNMLGLFVLTIFLCLILTNILPAPWRYNPYTRASDYYAIKVGGAAGQGWLQNEATGDILYYNGTYWLNLAKGSDGQVLKLASGIPSWAAESGGADEKVKIDAAATAGYLGAAYNDGVLRVDLNELTYTDGGDYITLGLANHDTARTALGLAIGTNVQAYDADLTTYAGITPSANVQTLLSAADYAAFKTSLSLNLVENTALSTWVGSSNIITLGTIGTGVWQGTSIGTTYTDAKCTATWPNTYSANQNLSTTSDVQHNDLTVDKLEANECFTYDAFQATTGDGTTTIDWGLGNLFYFTFGAQNDTFTFTAPPGSARLILILKQDATGSRTATWPATVLWPGDVAPTLTTTANAVDIVALIWDGTSYYGLFNGDFK